MLRYHFMRITRFIKIGTLSLILGSNYQASGQLNPWLPIEFEDLTKELNRDSSAFFFYEDGLPFTHLYTVHFGREDEIADEVYHISSKYFPSIESSANMVLLLFRPYALTANKFEPYYQGKLSHWLGYEALENGQSTVLATATKETRMAELSVLKKEVGVDWFLIVTNIEDTYVDNKSWLSSR